MGHQRGAVLLQVAAEEHGRGPQLRTNGIERKTQTERESGVTTA